MAKIFTIILMVFISVTLSSCKVHNKPVEIALDVPESVAAEYNGQSANLSSQWWRAFGDEQLNSLIESSLSGNLTLSQLWQRVEQAKYTAKIAGANLYPSIDVGAEASRFRTETDTATNYNSLYSSGLFVNYEVDIWGRMAANAAAGVYLWEASEQDMNAAKISIASQVAQVWFLIVERRGQLKLLDEQIRINTDSLDLITLQFKRGQNETTDVLQQRQLLESRVGLKRLVEAELEVFKNQLAVLTGKSPGMFETPPSGNLPQIDDTQSAGLTGELIERRPDIQAAFLRVQAADKLTAVFIAQRMPSINLGASLVTSDDQIKGLFDNWQTSIGVDLFMPVFDAGRRKAQVDRQNAATQEAVYFYTDTVIRAIREVRDAAALEWRQKQYIESLEKQMVLSKQSIAQIKENYLKGAADYLRFLTAQLTDQNLEREYLIAKRDLVTYRIDLYKSLAGDIGGNDEMGITN